jgi:glycosyltransferase involved in cell wall biosynthesis
MPYISHIFLTPNQNALNRVKALHHLLLGIHFSLLLREKAVFHIHAHHAYSSSFIAMVAAKLLDITFSITLHGSDLLISKHFLELKIHESKFLFTISDYNKRQIIQRYGKRYENKISVIRLGVDTQLFDNHRAYKNHKQKHMLILAAGRLEKVKNFLFLVENLAEAKKRSIIFTCLIVGDGSQKRRLEKLIKKNDLTQNVKLLGICSKEILYRLVRTADVFVMTSKSEGIPQVLMEAMNTYTTVLAPKITGIPELVIDKKTGFLFTPDDKEDFLDNLESIYKNTNAAPTVLLAAKKHLTEFYDEHKNLHDFLNTFITKVFLNEYSNL